MKILGIALGTLTIIPIRRRFEVSSGELSASTGVFPLVGLGIGGLLWATAVILSPYLPPSVLSALMVIELIFITGGLHLDGLGDLCDGLAAGGTPEHRRSVMKDPRAGAFGVMGITGAILLKFALFGELIRSGEFADFILMAVLGRWGMVIAATWGKYPSAEGTGKPFIGKIGWLPFLGAFLLSVSIAGWLSGAVGVILTLCLLPGIYLLVRIFERHLGGITGDSLGTVNETGEVFVLLCLVFYYSNLV